MKLGKIKKAIVIQREEVEEKFEKTKIIKREIN